MNIKTYTFKFSPLKKKTRDIFFIESSYDEKINNFIIDNYDKIYRLFANNGFIFRYFPKYAQYALGNSRIAKEYGLNREKLERSRQFINSTLLDYLDTNNESIDVKPSLLYWSDNFDDQNSKDSVTLEAVEIDGTADLLKEFRKLAKGIRLPYIDDQFNLFSSGRMFHGTPDMLKGEQAKLWKQLTNISQQLLSYFPSKEDFLQSLSVEIKPTDCIVIDKDCRILLPNYNNKEILHKNFLSRAFYILYLRHPEGIRTEYLSDYHSEFVAIYKNVTKKKAFDIKEQRSIDNFHNTLVTRRHEIKEAFIEAVGKMDAQPYIIDGHYQQPKRIELAVLEKNRKDKIKSGELNNDSPEYIRWDNKMLPLIPKNSFKEVVGKHDKTVLGK